MGCRLVVHWYGALEMRSSEMCIRDSAKLYLKEHPDVAAEIEKQVRENADRLLAAGKKGTVKPGCQPRRLPLIHGRPALSGSDHPL